MDILQHMNEITPTAEHIPPLGEFIRLFEALSPLNNVEKRTARITIATKLENIIAHRND